jgi:ankyrin repeat protein
VNKYIEARPNERYMRFELTAGEKREFWEIYVPDRFNIWICEGAIGSEGINSHLSWRDWGSMDEGVNLQWASKLVNAKEKVGFVYAGEIKKVIDDKYRSSLVSENPQDLLLCIKEGYSPFSVVDIDNKVGSAMEIAIAGGVTESVGNLLSAGCNINRLPEWKDVNFDVSRSPLLFALEYSKNLKMIEFILALGADVNKTSGYESKVPLHAADSTYLTKLFLDHGANIDIPDTFGRTALHRRLNYSGSDTDLEIIKILIESKANVNTKDISEDTPLITAATNANYQAVQLLLANGADWSACNKKGENALIGAMTRRWHGKGDGKAKTIELLLNAGLDPDSRMKGRVTALMVACESRGVVESDLRLLLNAGADINAKDKDGKTALMRVASENSGPMVKLLLKLGADIDLQDSSGKTAVMYSTMSKRYEKWKSTPLKILIKAGANLAIEDKSGRGALQTDSEEAAIILLDAGSVPNAVDGQNLLKLAFTKDNLTLALKVLEKGTYLISADGFNLSKNKLSNFINKIVAVNSSLLSSLTSKDADVQALLTKNLGKVEASLAIEYAENSDLPDLLKPGGWPRAGKGKPPALPVFWNAQVHPAPILRSNSKPLPAQAVDTIARMVLMSTYDAPISEIAEIEAVCERQSLANFALSIFLEWSDKGGKANDGLFQVLGYWGDSKAARTLTPLIQHWPKVQLSHRSAMGLEILGSMGSDIALTQINAIAAKTKYESVRSRSEALLQKVASDRNLSAEQLEDRLVPSLELSDDGTMKLDFGDRYFVASVDEQLQPILKDTKNATIKTLPKATAVDDADLAAQAAERWREFKKQLKPLAGLQLARFEQAMSNSRRWLGEEFSSLLLNHPLLQKVVHGLVWAVYEQDSIVSTFSFRPDGTAIDATGQVVTINADARIGVPHPLDLADSIEAWKDIFRNSKKAQPFPQLVRKVYAQNDDIDGTLFGLQGLVVPSLAFKGLKSLGWNRDEETFGGTFSYLHRRFPSGSASITVSPGLNLAAYDAIASEQTLSIDCEGLAPTDYSELIRELQTLKA